jgi:hypothetical protein
MNDLLQGDLFGKVPAENKSATNTSTALLGLPVQMPAPCPRCKGMAGTLDAGKAMHAAAIMCACNRFCGWLSHADYQEVVTFVAVVERNFGKVTEPIRIRHTKR